MKATSPDSEPSFTERYAPRIGVVDPAPVQHKPLTLYEAYFEGSPRELLRDYQARPAHYAEHAATLHALQQGGTPSAQQLFALVLRYWERSEAEKAPEKAAAHKPQMKVPVYEDGAAAAGDIILF